MNKRLSDKLYKKDSKGKMREWSMSLYENEDGTTNSITDSGLVGGGIASRSKPITSNARQSSFQRATTLMLNAYDKKLRTGYYYSAEEAGNAGVLFAPMKAQKCSPEKLPTPMYSVQPKVNGVRAPYNWTEDKLHTKTGLQYVLPELQRELMIFATSLKCSIDGELYIPGLTAPEIAGKARNIKAEGRDQFEYHVYDIMTPDGFEIRGPELAKAFHKTFLTYGRPKFMKLVPTVRVRYDRDTQRWYDTWLNEGWEGLIIRLDGVGYEYGKRTKNLLKWKPVFDGEFPVVHITYEYRVHKNEKVQLVEFHCEYKGEMFKVIPAWSVEERFQWYKDHKDMPLGQILDSLQPLRCEYRELTKNDIPFHAVGIEFRDPSY